MPSKKKAKGKARRAAKSRKAKEEDGAVNSSIDWEDQRLLISNNNSSKDEDEDAMLEAAINLAAAERDELEAAAKNEEEDNSDICNHGLVPYPRNHICVEFLGSFADEFNACNSSNRRIDHFFEHIYEAMKATYAEVWNDSEKIQWVASYFIMNGTNEILGGNYPHAGIRAMCSSFFEQWAAEIRKNETQDSCDWKIFQTLCYWGKISELCYGDEHTLVSFFRKRIPCNCLDSKYEEVKSIKKIGICCNTSCSPPDKIKKTVRSTMFYCTQCRNANYCSRECQVAHWPTHKQFCIATALRLASRKSRQKRR